MPELGGLLTPEVFRRRFALATSQQGGIVLDVETGSYSRLNAAGAGVLEALTSATDIEGAIAAIADRLSCDTTVAGKHLAKLSAALVSEGVRREPLDPFRYRSAEGGGYDVWHDDTLVLHVGEDGTSLTMRAHVRDLPLRLYDYVSGIAPKILFLRGITVLHGSSCLRSGRLVGFSGKSRAGKTTTARTFARHGWPLASEDLLLFEPDLAKPAVFADGESRVHAWSRHATACLELGPGATTDTETLVGAAAGATIPVEALWFLDATRRRERLVARPMGHPDAIASVMANHFLGGGTPASWRRHLGASHTIAMNVSAFEVELPNGLVHLEQAIQTYTTNSAS